ncbi:MAG: hypothetical protein EOP86_05590 [Verrucomicrobiaceae bacterium]|nr:MAG: hypothetical protein EOP86_05590 [Verrucomicrobiaceae bacterium]
MNPILKGILLVAIACGVTGWVWDSEIAKDQEKLTQDLADARSNLRHLDKQVEDANQRRISLQGEIDVVTELEKQHNNNMAAIPQEQKKAAELLEKLKAADADRASAVQVVREAEKKAAPRTLTLKDNSKLEQFVLKNVAEDGVLSVEHANGIMKLTPDRLTAEYSKHLGLEWKVAFPDPPNLTPDQKATVAVAQQAVDQKIDPAEKVAMKQLEGQNASEELAKVETALGITKGQLEDARQEVRALDIRKADAVVKGSNKTYGDLKVAASEKVSALARKLVSLQQRRRILQKTIEGIKADGY